MALGVFCIPKFMDTATPAGVPNLVEFAPNMWRMGQPPAGSWNELAARIDPQSNGHVVIVKLDDEVEGNDDPAEVLGWSVVKIPIPPEDDKIWTVLVKPNPADVRRAVQSILAAHAAGSVVAWHCVHGRDRTGLISALVGMKMFGWTKQQAWNDMIAHGFRWELPDLDAYWFDDITGK